MLMTDHTPTYTWVNMTEAARMLMVSPKTVSRWCKEGRIAHSRTLGGHARFRLDQLEELVRQHQAIVDMGVEARQVGA